MQTEGKPAVIGIVGLASQRKKKSHHKVFPLVVSRQSTVTVTVAVKGCLAWTWKPNCRSLDFTSVTQSSQSIDSTDPTQSSLV